MKKIFLSITAFLAAQAALFAQNVQATLTPATSGQNYQAVIRLKNSTGGAITGNISSFTVGIRIPDQGANNPTLDISGLNGATAGGPTSNIAPAVVLGGYAYYLVAPNFNNSPFAMTINQEKDLLGLAFHGTSGTTAIIPSVEMITFQGGNPPGAPAIPNYQMEYYVFISGDKTEINSSFYASASSVGLNNATNPKVVGLNSVPLSVSWLSFTAEKAGDHALLNWATANETNNAGFEVERSADGKTFSKIGFVNTLAVAGNSNEKLAYSFTDSKPLNGDNHYRLKQTDRDGKASYSKTTRVSFGGGVTTSVALYPNPVSGATVRVKGNNISNVAVYNMAGQQIAVPVTYGVTENVLNASGLASGSYTIRVQAEGMVSNHKLVVQH
ncbi:T9SS type A sorting domain-containing protein [Taibaiella chishuiensis]|uniref:Putative secreted protein (Por secretion system target) n=1 Tax=Taibaiella chishuiensis TaxID=1434707 RepID=A0A2P8DAR1_9BACT|nr:T9SS type A sorting domain-containing protein [Taibaiella chishuiensis]PSK94302.1 putative secreted protein (Por secretion system target) [Taibaiella chishuiensis]